MAKYLDMPGLTFFYNQIKGRFAFKTDVGSPLKASTKAGMTDPNRIYIYTGSEQGMENGHWYYKDGNYWVDGGVYNSIAVNTDSDLIHDGVPADAKAVGDEVADLKSSIEDISKESGVNLLNQADFLNINDSGYDGEWYYFNSKEAYNMYGSESLPHRDFKENTQYIFSFDAKYNGSYASSIQFRINYSDGTNTAKVVQGAAENHYSVVTTINKTVQSVTILWNNNTKTFIKNLMFVEGVVEPEDFIPYNAITGYDETARKNVDAVSSKLDTFIISGNQQNLFSEKNAVAGYLNTSGTATTSNVNSKYNRTTGYIEIGDNEYVTIKTTMDLPEDVVHWQAFCSYDENKTLIGSRYVKTGGTENTEICLYKFPTGARYFRASSRAYNNWKIMLQFGTVNSAWTYNYDDIDYVQNELNNVKTKLNATNDSYIKSINHRGWTSAPENTLPAYIESKKRGFNYVETDVSFTSDGVPVLLHDSTINRTARNADGTSISGNISITDITYEDVLEYDFGIYKGSEYAGTKIPTLYEFLNLCKRIVLKPYIEIKNNATYTTTQIRDIVDAVRDYGMLEDCTFISFSYNYLRAVVDYNPYVRIGYVCSSVSISSDSFFNTVDALKTDYNEVFLDASNTSSLPTAITLCKTHGYPLELWTIDDSSVIRSMDPYISGITSNSLIASEILYNSIIS